MLLRGLRPRVRLSGAAVVRSSRVPIIVHEFGVTRCFSHTSTAVSSRRMEEHFDIVDSITGLPTGEVRPRSQVLTAARQNATIFGLIRALQLFELNDFDHD